MIITVTNEVPFQILSSSFSIGPSQSGYELQVGADSRSFSTLFSVGANTPRMVTNVANGSYFRLKNNVGDVKVNWQRVCVTEGGGGASGTELSPVSEFPAGAEAGTVIAYSGSSSAAGIYQFDGTDWVAAGGNSNILASITSQEEYEAISGSVKTGDLIQVWDVDINSDGENETGLFEAEVQEEEDGQGGDIIRIIYWERRDNQNSVTWADKVYPWMADNDVWPADFGENSFLISTDDNSEDEAYNGIGFDADGKPVITHIVPQYDEQTGEITGVTREDTPIGGGSSEEIELPIAAAVNDLKGNIEARLNQKYYTKQEVNGIVAGKTDPAQVGVQIQDYVDPAIEEVNDTIEDKELATSAALNDLNTATVKSSVVKNIWSGTQNEYDAIVVKDPATLYIIKD